MPTDKPKHTPIRYTQCAYCLGIPHGPAMKLFRDHFALLAACEAALAYDAALQKRVVDGQVNIMETGGGVAMGDDLDALYDDWINKTRSALRNQSRSPA